MLSKRQVPETSRKNTRSQSAWTACPTGWSVRMLDYALQMWDTRYITTLSGSLRMDGGSTALPWLPKTQKSSLSVVECSASAQHCGWHETDTRTSPSSIAVSSTRTFIRRPMDAMERPLTSTRSFAYRTRRSFSKSTSAIIYVQLTFCQLSGYGY